MAPPSRSAAAKASRKRKAPAKTGRARATAAVAKLSKRAATNAVIATELAPAVAIALLDKIEQPADAPAPALVVLAAGAVASDTDGTVRVQLLFENGAVLPVEMSTAAGAALSKGLAEELPKK